MASDVVEAFSSEADAYQQRVEDAFDAMAAFYVHAGPSRRPTPASGATRRNSSAF